MVSKNQFAKNIQQLYEACQVIVKAFASTAVETVSCTVPDGTALA